MVVVGLISVAALQMATQFWHLADMSEISQGKKINHQALAQGGWWD
jgi:hypothetical protein